ncbi:MAG: polysaccharide pyruvyl transferase family protein [candidate division SR1 bacterium]|nr:polysaccharide pyruvyl transferase family protein [candidate division SR1 bacterium]
MKIYLKGYYGYKNFGDELLLFGVIKEIFSRYAVEHLVIEVGNHLRIKKWIERNKKFITARYKKEGVVVDREKISFFSLDDRFYWVPQKFRRFFSHIAISLGFHPYSQYFKIFGGGEVIDETRSFPHNGWNIPLLYGKTIIKKNFGIWGGIGSQIMKGTHFLSHILLKNAKNLLLRDIFSYSVAEEFFNDGEIKEKPELIQDFSTGLLEFLKSFNNDNKKKDDEYCILNLSPTVNINKQDFIKIIDRTKKRVFFPCDLNFDPKILEKFAFKDSIGMYDWSEHSLEESLDFIRQSSLGIGSRLHFLYCYKIFGIKFVPLSSSNKLKYNLD